MNLASAQNLLSKPGEITMIDMSVDYLKGTEETLLSEIKEGLANSQVSSQRQENMRQDDLLNRLVGMLVISLTISSAVRERTREIGIFRALGFRKSHIIKIILYEDLIICVIGGVIGFLIGMFLANYAAPIFFDSDVKVTWNILLFFISILISVVIGILSSLYPALKAVKLDPAEALRFI